MAKTHSSSVASKQDLLDDLALDDASDQAKGTKPQRSHHGRDLKLLPLRERNIPGQPVAEDQDTKDLAERLLVEWADSVQAGDGLGVCGAASMSGGDERAEALEEYEGTLVQEIGVRTVDVLVSGEAAQELD